MEPFIFEACCGSAADAIAAYKGGAQRVELNSDLFHGGLTPSVGELIIAKKHCPDLQIMCMVRPREGGFHYTDLEYETILADAKALLDNGADGIVFGFLHEDGTIDRDRCKEMLTLIGDKESVFHRAIDVVPDVFAALDTLIELGVTRVLTSGQKPTVPEGLETIKAMIEHAGGRIQILPGGGVKPENAKQIRIITGTNQLHASRRVVVYDRSCMGNPAIHFGGAIEGNYPPEDCYKITSSEETAALITAAQLSSP